ncbi:MAG TPA: hypothetical protein VNT03_07025 [Baekduia sp.]|nr:hypothetical protein [Baekduia sp.]
MWIARGEDGQASVELVALLPVLVGIVLLAWQAVVAGEAWWLASAAAREAARAAALGGDPRAAAAEVLPAPLRRDLRVRPDGDAAGVSVRVAVPPVLAGIRVGSVTVRARMEPQS